MALNDKLIEIRDFYLNNTLDKFSNTLIIGGVFVSAIELLENQPLDNPILFCGGLIGTTAGLYLGIINMLMANNRAENDYDPINNCYKQYEKNKQTNYF